MLSLLADMEAAIDVVVPTSPTLGVNTLLDQSIDEAYLQDVINIKIDCELKPQKLKIVFSPEHGTASYLGMELFTRLGYNVIPVESQMTADPAFSNTKTPNPEEDGAYEEAIKLAQLHQADIILVTDPDADRLGLAYLDSNGDYARFTGNESGALLLDYILMKRQKLGLLRSNSAIYSTIVTSELGNKVAQSYGVSVKLFLTGFKYIGDQVEKRFT